MPAVRVGLIGYGAWGRHHARAIASVPTAELKAICSRTPENAAEARAAVIPQATIYADYREMLEKEDLELCDVVLPSDLHYDVSRAVLDSGRHLLLEKPMTLSIAALPRADRPGPGTRPRAGGRARAPPLVAVGEGQGARRRRRNRRTAVRADRAVAAAVPARLRRLAVRHPPRRRTGFSRSRSTSSTSPGGT